MADEASDVGGVASGAPLASELSSSTEGDGQVRIEGVGEDGANSDDAAAGSEAVPLVAASQLAREVALEPLSEEGGVPLVADALAGKPTCFVNQEVSLSGDAEPVLGSFTVDGLTFAVTGEGEVELVAVAPGVLAGGLAAGEPGGEGSGAPSAEGIGSGASASPQSSPEGAPSDGPEGEGAVLAGTALGALAGDAASPEGADGSGSSEPVPLAVPGTVEHGAAAYSVSSVGPRAFAGCAADVASLPATVVSVDEAAFRGSLVGAVEVEEGNPHVASYEGVLYDADFSDLLLIPEGKKGAVRIHSNTSAITPDAFSHCASVTSVEVDAGNESFYVEDGVLHSARGYPLRFSVDNGSFDSDLSNSSTYSAGTADLNKGVRVNYFFDKTLESETSYHDFLDVKLTNIPNSERAWTAPGDCQHEHALSFSKSAHMEELQGNGYILLNPSKEFKQGGKTFNVSALTLGLSNLDYSTHHLVLGNLLGSFGFRPTWISKVFLRSALVGKGDLELTPGVAYWLTDLLDAGYLYALNDGKYQVDVYICCDGAWGEYTVTWDHALGDNSQTTVRVRKGETAHTPVGITRTGYTLKRWVSDSLTVQPDSAFTPTSDTLLRADWTPNPYTINYHTRSGTYLGSQSATYDQGLSLWNATGGSAGYTANGWATSAWQGSGSYGLGAWASNLATGGTVNLYLAETPNPYTIRYHDKAGNHLGDQGATYDQGFTLWGDPNRSTPGYTAVGWARSASQSTATHAFGQSVSNLVTSGNADFYLAEVPNQYQVTLDAAFPAFATGSTYEGYAPYGVAKDAGTLSVTATFDAGMPAATMPKATGYRFEGYFDDAGTCYYDADGSSVRTWDKPNGATLHGRWSVERHELTLDVGNGEVPDATGRGWSRDEGEAGLYRLSYSIEWRQESGGSPRIQLPARAAKPGYESFEGWVGPNLSKPSTVVQVQPWELADKAYSGVFSGAIGYSASLDLAGGSFASAPEGWSEANGLWSHGFTVESEAFSLPTPERHGYGFEGWAAVTADGSLGEPAKDVTVPKGSWGDRSWRATWKAVSYSISYDLAGGEMSGQRESYTMEDPDFELPVPAREGYSFQGWEVTGANGAGLSQQGVVTTVRQGTWGDLSCTARWAAVSCSVVLSLEGGSFATAPDGWSESGGTWTRAFTVESDAFQLPTPARPGHDFLGWALVAADGSLGSPAASVTVPKGTVGDRSYRAMWQARTYVVTWHYSGQAIDGKGSVTADQAYGSPIAFPSRPSVADPAREHYSFAGWFTAQEGGERVQAGDYLLESDATFYARWSPVEYVAHLHLGDDDAHGEHKAAIEQGGTALPMAPDGHFDLPYTVEDEVSLPTVTDDPEALKPVREGMSFMGWVECAEDGSFDADLVPSMEVVLPKGSHSDRHYRALWSFALRFEVPSAVSFRFDLADDPAFADAPYGPVEAVSGEGVELRSLSLGRLAVADVALDVAGARPDDIVTDRSKVSLRVMDASSSYGYGWVPLPTTAAPERLDPFDLEPLGFGSLNALAPLSSKPLRYEARVNDADTTLAGEVDGLPLAKVVFTVQGLW